MYVQQHQKATVQKRSHENDATQGVFRYLIRGGIVLNVVLGFMYLLMLNALSTQGFDLETLKAEKFEIQKQMEAVDIALAIPTSIYALESNEQVQNMADITYRTFVEVQNDGQLTMVDKAMVHLAY